MRRKRGNAGRPERIDEVLVEGAFVEDEDADARSDALRVDSEFQAEVDGRPKLDSSGELSRKSPISISSSLTSFGKTISVV